MNHAIDSGDPAKKAASRPRITCATVMIAAFCAALLVRIVYIVSFRDSSFFNGLIVDAQWHDEWANGWAAGTWDMGGRAFFRAPLYPFFLSLLYRVFGHDLLAARIVQAVVGSGTAAALAGCGWRIGGPKMSLWTALVAVLYGPFLFFDGELLIPNLLVALLSWSLFFILARPSIVPSLLSALFLGLAAVARPNSLVLVPIFCIFIWVRARAENAARGRAVGLFLAVSLLPALFVTAVNVRAEKRFVFIASQAGVNFYAGNNQQATGMTVVVPELSDRQTGWSNFVELSSRAAEEEAGRSLDSEEVSNFWTRKALAWIKAHPREAAALTLKKVYYVLNAHEIANNRDPYLERPFPLNLLLWRFKWFAFPWGLIFPLAVAGAVSGCRKNENRRTVLLLLGWVVIYLVFLVPFFITARFRMGAVPAVLLLAAYALSRWRAVVGIASEDGAVTGAASKGRAFLSAAPLAAGIAALIFVNTNLFGVGGGNPAQEKAKLGAALLLENRLEESRAVLEEALAEEPNSADYTFLLGQVHFLAGRYAEALEMFQRSTELNPTNYRVLYYVANSLIQLGRTGEAASALRKAVEMHPGDGEIWSALGGAYEGLGELDQAIGAFSRAVECTPSNEVWYLELGYLYHKKEDMEKAIDAWKRGSERFPASYALHYNLAVAYAQTEQYIAALGEVEKALGLRGDSQDAKRLQSMINQKMREFR